MITKVVNFIQQYPYISLLVTFIGMILYQSLNLFWGFEILDSGYHLTAFQNIYDAPNTVADNFGYYLTNLVGGAFIYIFPDMGIIHFRIIGAVCVLIAIAFIYFSLWREVPLIHLLIGLSLVVLCYVKAPYSFNNGILSCLLYVIACLILYKGINRNSSWLIFIAGIIVGINIFTRIPNILGIGLLLIILLHRKFIIKSDPLDWGKSFFFAFGVLMGIGFVALLMIQLGHLGIFIDDMKILFSSTSEKDSTYSITTLILAYLNFYMTNAISIMVFYSLFQIHNIISDKNKLLIYLFDAIAIIWLFNYVYYLDTSYRVLWGMCVVGCLMCIFRQRGKLRLFSILALYMLFVEIMGSDFALNHGCLPALLAAPVASMMIINRNRLLYLVVFVLAVMSYAVRRGNYADDGPIYAKMASINCPQAKFILTTDEKADAINSTMKGIEPFVHPGDTLMCFPAAPMMNFLTHTYPAGGSSWPCILNGNCKFFRAIEGTPKILFNKFPSFAQSWSIGGNTLDSKYSFDIKSFILRNQYKKVFENEYFVLYVNN